MNSLDHKDLAAGRMEKIGQILRQRHIARVNELCDQLGASPASIRRDLVDMERRGLLQRVHGGAMFTDHHAGEPLFDDKAAIATKEKQRIADAAFKFIKPNDSIYLDGGSTVLALARLLMDMTKLTVVTNSLRVAGLFAAGGPKMILVGGEFRRLSQTFVGSLTKPLIDNLHLDAAFMGTIGLTDSEITTTDPAEAYTKDLVMRRARQAILLADHSKIGKASFVKAGTLEDLDVLITDSRAHRKDVQQFRKKGIKVVVV
jgi:DeoR/GlpR family transcriptional regulator of sugar metabolism